MDISIVTIAYIYKYAVLYIYSISIDIPVAPHKAVAEVSEIGNL